MPEIDNSAGCNSPNDTRKEYSQDWKYELSGLIGFCLSGAIFIVSGIHNGDILTVLGSFVWIISCIVWIIPYKKYF